MSLTLLLLPSSHASEQNVILDILTVGQAIAVVKAYGIGHLDVADLVQHHSDITEGNPYETIMTLSDFAKH